MWQFNKVWNHPFSNNKIEHFADFYQRFKNKIKLQAKTNCFILRWKLFLKGYTIQIRLFNLGWLFSFLG